MTSCVPTAPGRRLTCLTWRLTTQPVRSVEGKSLHERKFSICLPEMCKRSPLSLILSSCAGGGVPGHNQGPDRGPHIRLQCHRVRLRTHRFVKDWMHLSSPFCLSICLRVTALCLSSRERPELINIWISNQTSCLLLMANL